MADEHTDQPHQPHQPHQPDDPSAPLRGRWRLLRADPALDFAPEAGMDFREHGELLYSFAVGDQRFELSLRYGVSGDVLRTNNPASAQATEVHYRIGAGDVLVLDFAGAEACFLRDEAY